MTHRFLTGRASAAWLALCLWPGVSGAAAPLPDAARIEAQRKAVFGKPLAAVPADQRLPAESRIQTEQARIEAERRSVFADPDLGRSPGGNAFPTIPTPARAQVDPMAIAQQYAARAGQRKQEELLAFASLSMPVESLKRLIREVGRVGGVVVLRGFKDRSFKATAAAIQALGVDASAVQINPNAFTQYRIEAVPALVLVKADTAMQLDGQGCALPDHYAGVTGDVSLRYALDTIAQRSPDYAPLARRYLTTLGDAR